MAWGIDFRCYFCNNVFTNTDFCNRVINGDLLPMRIARELHTSMFRQYSDHIFSEKLERIDSILNKYPEVADWVLEDLASGKDARGAKGMTAEEVLRAALLMQIEDLTYRQLEFHLVDSVAMRAFVHISDGVKYSDSTLQANIKSISPATWQKIHLMTVMNAKESGLEKGRTVRLDATVVETDIALPRDSQLLVDCLRVITQIVAWMKGKELVINLLYKHKKAKSASLAILNAKDADEREQLYLPLIVGAGDVWKQIPKIIEMLNNAKESLKSVAKRIDKLAHVRDHLEAILAQTIARVIDKDKVLSSDKVISIFEEHSDIIVKSRRETEFGHKLFITTGKSNLVIDCEIAEGNPADSDRFMDLLDRVKDVYGKYPRETSADGGFASAENVEDAKEAGVTNVCFNKRCCLEISDMCKSRAVFNRLAKFRAGVESNISALKRGYGLTRAVWKGLDGFKSYVWSAVVAYNLMLLAD